MNNHDLSILCVLVFLCILLMTLLRFLLKTKNKKQLHKAFIIIFALMLSWLGCMILQLLLLNKFNLNIKYFFNIYYISLCLLPVAFLFMATSFAKNEVKIKKIHYILLVVPILSIILLWTNDFHHLFYKVYSVDVSTEYGWYFYVHTFYTYFLFAISIVILLKYSIKNSGFFSKQAILILAGTLVPLVVNILGSIQIIRISIYTTPITFAVTITCFTFAIFKFDLFKITPIALQNIVDRISDSYIILNENYDISDYNKTFLDTFEIPKTSSIRGINYETLFKKYELDGDIEKFYSSLKNASNSNTTAKLELYIKNIEKYFRVEITSIISNNRFVGIIVLFKDITQHNKDMETIKNNQNMLIERERLASLGQMVGGIAHSLKTPIFSLSGGLEALTDLITEFDESIDDPSVNNQDMHEIAGDMKTWIDKMKGHLSYMSEVITTVKGQAVNLSGDDNVEFTISELFSHTNILMKHEFQAALITLKIDNRVPDLITLYGNINSLVQVLNNLLSNAIQAYNKKPNQIIELSAKLSEQNITISIKDYGPGLPEKVKNKLFKEMITTKGKEGTGLGVYMSYSLIKAKFNGDINFETSSNGTTFNVVLPLTVVKKQA